MEANKSLKSSTHESFIAVKGINQEILFLPASYLTIMWQKMIVIAIKRPFHLHSVVNRKNMINWFNTILKYSVSQSASHWTAASLHGRHPFPTSSPTSPPKASGCKICGITNTTRINLLRHVDKLINHKTALIKSTIDVLPESTGGQ